MNTYTLIIEGIKWAYGLTKKEADAEINLFNEQFCNPSIVLVPEL